MAPTTVRLSLTSGGRQVNGDSYGVSISADGRYVVFASDAVNLVSGDINGVTDIFLHDRVTKQVRLISRAPGGVPANEASYWPTISADGRYVAYESYASNLVAGDTNNAADIFRYDRVSGATVRVSVATGGAQADGDSIQATISNDGSHVAFASAASTLVAGDTNAYWDVFARNVGGATTRRASVGPAGVEGNGDSLMPAISGNDNFVAFASAASNLVAGDTNGRYDIFVRDIATAATARASLGYGAAGAQANGDSWQPHISTDGRYVVFATDASNLVSGDTNGVTDILVRNRGTHGINRVSVTSGGLLSDGASYHPKISDNGRYAIFESQGALQSGDSNGVADVYLRDRWAPQKTIRLSVSTAGVSGNGESLRPVMSADGRYVAFESFAANLVRGDTNLAWDIFLRDRGVGTTPTYPPYRSALLTGAENR